MTTVALVDDHTLIRHALIELISRFENFQVTIDAGTGLEFINRLQHETPPDIALIDINMPGMDGYETTELLCKSHPDVIPIALSVDDNEESIIKMLRCGAKGYLLKDSEPSHFKLALNEIHQKGYFHSDLVSNTLLKSIKTNQKVKTKPVVQFQAREEEFIHLACSEYTYKEIADKMCVSPRTIDGYRESLFEKLEVKSRVGLVMFAIRNGLVVI
ncbi:response regulator [Emticicia sp. CRIBPO]|jgi:two-component system, NarL family, invasion response regulator UvrY|uniref:response regulator n=1 Tax=Emticicia sp. CRIBPO TaxID=2683258 RepID=UPI0014136094|nr:response regulator transcription factor [Emticicia sp. CRIBPO]NBA87191.1 response regulator [Emticicia sp. CRIBPO]